MASYHLTAKIGKSGKGKSHAAYITRESKEPTKPELESQSQNTHHHKTSQAHPIDPSTGELHADYIERSSQGKTQPKQDLEHSESGNLPKWAKTSRQYWSAADKYERANGSVYRELEIALPRELNPQQRLILVKEFIAQEIGEKHTYTYAIHNPAAAIEGGEQPHAHIMYSERKLDGIERSAEQHFKRYNAKHPEKGGCQKASGGKTANQLKAELLGTRERFATLQNHHLKLAGVETRVDHRSLKDQGIEREVEPHLGPNRRDLYPALREHRQEQQLSRKIEAGIARAEKNFAQWEKKQALKAQQAAQEKAQKEQQAQQERERIQALKPKNERDQERGWGISR